jgi:malate synthase
MEAWFRGTGCVPLFNLMEDAATAEISRTQLWQWVHHGCHLKDGRKVDEALCDRIIQEELEKAKKLNDLVRYAAYEKAARLTRELICSKTFVGFLTIPAYQQIVSEGK